MFLGYGIQEYRISAVEKIDIPEGFILEPLVQDHNKEPSGNMLLEYRISVVEEFLYSEDLILAPLVQDHNKKPSGI